MDSYLILIFQIIIFLELNWSLTFIVQFQTIVQQKKNSFMNSYCQEKWFPIKYSTFASLNYSHTIIRPLFRFSSLLHFILLKKIISIKVFTILHYRAAKWEKTFFCFSRKYINLLSATLAKNSNLKKSQISSGLSHPQPDQSWKLDFRKLNSW